MSETNLVRLPNIVSIRNPFYFPAPIFDDVMATSDAMWGQPLLTRFTALYICAAKVDIKKGETSRGGAQSPSLAALSLLLFETC